MIEVTQKDFYAAIGGMDIIPRPHGPYRDVTGYEVSWELRDRTVLGHSNGEGSNKRYWLSEKLMQAPGYGSDDRYDEWKEATS